uniref:hypothetical protein n=1 Tax=Nonomuraea pusilla TaxID=46177 RepID=UPI000B04B0FD|nr:hypothetical protein [Nonomuraea pusilla]
MDNGDRPFPGGVHLWCARALALLLGVHLWGVQALAVLLGLSALGGFASAAAGRTF